MICLGCGLPTSNPGRFCNGCLEVLHQDGDRWTFNHPEDVALREKILAQRDYLSERDLGDEDVHDDTLDKGTCPHCMKYALDSALAALGRAIRGAT